MSRPLRVLLVEDSEADAARILRGLRRAGYEPTALRVATVDALRTALDGPWDLILSDYSLPGVDGLTALALVRQKGLDVPFIIVSGTTKHEAVVATIKAGAHDYVVKRDLTRLAPAVERELKARRRRRLSGRGQTGRGVWVDHFFAASPVGMCILDARLRFVQINPRLAEINGPSVDDHLGRTVREVLPELAPTVEPFLRRVLASGQPVLDVEISGEVPSQPGALRHWLGSYLPIPGASGSPAAVGVVVVEVTERKRAEQALQEGHGLLSAGLEGTPDAIFVRDPDGRYLLINSAGARFLGKTVEEVIGRTTAELAPADVARRFEEDDARILATGETETREWTLPMAGGERTFLTTKGILRDARGHPAAILGSARDITDRKQVEVARAQLAALVESSDDAIIGHTLEGTVLSWNGGAERLYGYTAKQMIGRSLSILIPPDRADELVAILSLVKSGSRVDHYETVRVTSAGRRIDIAVTVSPVKDASGRIIAASVIARDITERRRATDALREREALFRSLSTSSPLGIFLGDAQGRTTYSNPRCRELLELAGTETMRDRWPSVVHPEDRARVTQAWQTAVRQAKEYRAEYRIVTPRGALRWLRARTAPMRSPDGAVTGHVGTLEDITETKQAAVERERLVDELRATNERLRHLAHEILAAQEAERRRIARELHDEVGQILTALKLGLQLSREQPAPEARASLREVEQHVDQLLSRVRNMSLDLRPIMLDDLGLLPALLWHFERFTALTSVRVVFHHAGVEGKRFPPEVETAAYRIVQEALTNVARHTHASEATVRIWIDEKMLRVQVEDRGTGFDPARPLTRTPSSGLSGMRERAALLGGEVTIEAAPGRGTSVTAGLPLRVPEG